MKNKIIFRCKYNFFIFLIKLQYVIMVLKLNLLDRYILKITLLYNFRIIISKEEKKIIFVKSYKKNNP